MEIQVHFEPNDIQKVRTIVTKSQNHRVVIERIDRNVSGPIPAMDRSEFWRTLLACLLTSQQRSDSEGRVWRFLNEKPFRISLSRCNAEHNIERFVQSNLSEFKGIRFPAKIGREAARNLQTLESGGWNNLENWVARLKSQRARQPNVSDFGLERDASKYMDDFAGFGPKQSRNFWQMLGLTRYEFVLDSRMTRWLREAEIGLPLSPTALASEDYYSFLSNILRDLCTRAEVLPCVFDAAVFAEYEQRRKSIQNHRS